MSDRVVIQNGMVYTQDGTQQGDIVIEGERIAAVLPPGTACDAEQRVDAGGWAVLPGMIDMHVHIDDTINGIALADDFSSASRIAVLNGITSFVGFATQRPNERLLDTIRTSIRKGLGRSFCDYSFHVTPTRFDAAVWEDIASMARHGFRTMKLYTTYREAGLYTDWDAMQEIMARCHTLGIRILVHCEAEETLRAVDRAGIDETSPAAQPLLRPEAAERDAVERVLALAASTQCDVHIVHVSSSQSAQLLDRKCRPRSVTCETAPHYLMFNHDLLSGEHAHRYRCTPPLRSEACRAELEAAAAQGTIDVFATDHCAFTKQDKDRFAEDCRNVPSGLPGIGALVPRAFELLRHRHADPLEELTKRLALNPARVSGLYPRKGAIQPGADADLVLVNPEGAPHPVASTLADAYDTVAGEQTTLNVDTVWVRGEMVVRHGRLVEPNSMHGTCLWAID